MQIQVNKKAVSLIVSYVLLISIGLSIAGLVFGWLKFYTNIGEPEKCPDGVSLIIMDSSYHAGSLGSGELDFNITLQNRGRFDIGGYVIRVNNRSGSSVGIFELYSSLNEVDMQKMVPGNSFSHSFNYTDLGEYGKICFVEVQPFIIDKNNQTGYCTQISTRIIDC